MLAVCGKKKVPLGLDIFQGVHLCLENEPNPMGEEKTTEQVKKALNISRSIINKYNEA